MGCLRFQHVGIWPLGGLQEQYVELPRFQKSELFSLLSHPHSSIPSVGGRHGYCCAEA